MYTNARNERKKIVADAAGCMYKWYAWYMIAKMEKGYRMYKLVRMEDIELVKDMQAQPHPALREIIASMHDEKHQQPMIEIRLRCDKAKKLSICRKIKKLSYIVCMCLKMSISGMRIC